MIRVITSGTVTSVFAGMTGAIISAFFYGTAGLPFLCCSCAGFIVGSYGFYSDAVRKASIYLDRYPRLLQIHLDANFPTYGFNTWSLQGLRSSNFRSWQLRSMLIVGWLSAVPAIEVRKYLIALVSYLTSVYRTSLMPTNKLQLNRT